MLGRVIVAHPGRQHSHQLAAALNDIDRLEQYFCGIPTSPQTTPWYLNLFWRGSGNWDTDINPARVTCCPVGPTIRNLVSKFCGPSLRSKIGHRCDGFFDRIVSNRLSRFSYTAVVGYENAARRIFEVARDTGKVTILDAASVHHKMQDRVSTPSESRQEHVRITKNKDAEIQLADYILTTSDMAKESYLQAGAPPNKTFVIPMGVDLETFGLKRRVASTDSVLRLVFVGRFEEIKGSDILREAFELAQTQSIKVSLTIVGNVVDTKIASLPNVYLVGKKSHYELASILADHDALILPSRFDSFGMVVVEAMAVGIPVIVSPFVGSKMLVRHGWNGLVTTELSPAALLDSIKWLATNRSQLLAMGTNARETAMQFSWSEYRRRIREFFQVVGA